MFCDKCFAGFDVRLLAMFCLVTDCDDVDGMGFYFWKDVQPGFTQMLSSPLLVNGNDAHRLRMDEPEFDLARSSAFIERANVGIEIIEDCCKFAQILLFQRFCPILILVCGKQLPHGIIPFWNKSSSPPAGIQRDYSKME